MKTKTAYICSECGYQTPKWMGRCTSCGAWNTMQETVITQQQKKPSSAYGVPVHPIGGQIRRPMPINKVSYDSSPRYPSGIRELDRVLGGGIVRGSLVLVGGDPGIGKSTLLLQLCRSIGEDKKVLYISGEESEGQIKLRAERLGISSPNLYLISETDVETAAGYIQEMKPDVAIIDSIQTMNRADIASASGSVPQVREAANLFMRTAKTTGCAMFIVGHVTKDGTLAGPRILEHMVDCVLYFEGDRQLSFRILRAVKNRFGSTNEIGVFEMRENGLCEVENPSAMLLEGRPENASGSCVVCTLEGSRGVLAEVQALVTPTGFGNPRRMSSGIDLNRVILLIAVLEKRARMNLSNSDVYINVAGGLRIDDTAVDLGVCAAIAAGQSDVPLPPDMVFIGEVGLGGELRSVMQLEKRLSEAAKMGFSSAIVPKGAMRGVKIPQGLSVYGISSIREAMSLIRKK